MIREKCSSGKNKWFQRFFCIMVIFLFIVPVISSNQLQMSTSKQFIQHNTKEWTILFYIAADFGPINVDFLEHKLIHEIASSKNINVLVLQDLRWSPAFLYYVDDQHNMILLEEMGEVNMGDPQTLRDFISYGKEQYPAHRYQLCPYGHATAWYGICPDDTSNGDSISADELQQALRESGGVDLLSFIGCCLTGSLELVYEVKEYCDVVIASESPGNENDWVGMFDEMCNFMSENTALSTIDCSEQIVDLIGENENEYYDTMTISSVRTDKIEDLVSSFNTLCLHLMDADDTLYEHLKSARNNSKDFSFIRSSVLLDLGDFVKHYMQIETDTTLLQILQNLKSNLSETIIAEHHGDNQTGCTGLSVFYSSKDMLSTYANFSLDFTEDTHWDELLNEHKEKNTYAIFVVLREKILKTVQNILSF